MTIIKEIFLKLIKFINERFAGSYIQNIPNELAEVTSPLYALKKIYLDWGAEWGRVNIMGIRNDSNPGEWNDSIIVNIDNKIWKYEATVDPSLYYTKNPMKKQGCAHLCLGFHKNIWIIGMHRGKYTALVQRGGKCKIWRDKNKNFKNDDNIIEYKYSAINLHHGYSKRGKIGVHSAGCQVIRSKSEFEDFIRNVKEAGIQKFSYLLIPIQNCPIVIKNMKFGIWEDLQDVA